ncbi:MAG: ADP-ribosylglycohydrolase family protein [Actinomycetaceae bacterium]|nr:ADP-ribosylglycohydrolase family protein [Actinomycetaceae bacterium]
MSIPQPSEQPRQALPIAVTDEIIDRARGCLLAAACGDALGVPYEFAAVPENPEMIGGGLGPYAPAEWSDDTQMSVCIAQVAASGISLLTPAAEDRVGEKFLGWLQDGATDVGTQTRAVLTRATELGRRNDVSDRLHQAAREYSEDTDRAAGNGALMRTAPVGIAYLGSRELTAQAAQEIARLTHWDRLVDESCILWSEAIRVAVTTGQIDIRSGFDLIIPESRDYWAKALDDAESGNIIPHRNGFTVVALQCAWSTVWSVRNLAGEEAVREGIIQAVRLGSDTDTIATVAGALLGAAYGESAVPAQWANDVHGWPGLTGKQLADLAEQTVRAQGRTLVAE